MLLLTIVFISYVKTSICVKAIPGQPVPHAEILDGILRRQLGASYSNGAIDVVLGASIESNDTTYYTEDNLDVKILDVDNLKKIVNLAKHKFGNDLQKEHNNTRRGFEFLDRRPYIIDRALESMEQTMYFTKERINDTLPFRKKYKSFHSYNIAVLYGAATGILAKMEGLMANMQHFFWSTHFLWWLITYERILAGSTDITDIVEKIFYLHEQYVIQRGPKEDITEGPGGIDSMKTRPTGTPPG